MNEPEPTNGRRLTFVDKMQGQLLDDEAVSRRLAELEAQVSLTKRLQQQQRRQEQLRQQLHALQPNAASSNDEDHMLAQIAAMESRLKAVAQRKAQLVHQVEEVRQLPSIGPTLYRHNPGRNNESDQLRQMMRQHQDLMALLAKNEAAAEARHNEAKLAEQTRQQRLEAAALAPPLPSFDGFPASEKLRRAARKAALLSKLTPPNPYGDSETLKVEDGIVGWPKGVKPVLRSGVWRAKKKKAKLPSPSDLFAEGEELPEEQREEQSSEEGSGKERTEEEELLEDEEAFSSNEDSNEEEQIDDESDAVIEEGNGRPSMSAVTKVALVGSGRGEDDAKSAFTIKFEPTSTSFASVAIAVRYISRLRARAIGNLTDGDDILAEDEVTSLLQEVHQLSVKWLRPAIKGMVQSIFADSKLFLDLVPENTPKKGGGGAAASLFGRNRKKDAAAAAAADGEEASPVTGIPTPTEKEAEQYKSQARRLVARADSLLEELIDLVPSAPPRLLTVLHVLTSRRMRWPSRRDTDEENENTMRHPELFPSELRALHRLPRGILAHTSGSRGRLVVGLVLTRVLILQLLLRPIESRLVITERERGMANLRMLAAYCHYLFHRALVKLASRKQKGGKGTEGAEGAEATDGAEGKDGNEGAESSGAEAGGGDLGDRELNLEAMLELDSMVSQSFAPQLSRLQSEHAPSSLQKFAKAEADSQIISWMKKLLKRANKEASKDAQAQASS